MHPASNIVLWKHSNRLSRRANRARMRPIQVTDRGNRAARVLISRNGNRHWRQRIGYFGLSHSRESCRRGGLSRKQPKKLLAGQVSGNMSRSAPAHNEVKTNANPRATQHHRGARSPVTGWPDESGMGAKFQPSTRLNTSTASGAGRCSLTFDSAERNCK
jgi:hypothetical protein